MEENIEQSQEEQTQQPTMEKKSFPWIWVVMGVVILIIGVGAYAYFISNKSDSTMSAKNYVGNSTEECTRLQVLCIEGLQRFDDENGCGCEEVEQVNLLEVDDKMLLELDAGDGDVTSNRQTYRNEELEFTLEIPEDYLVKLMSTEGGLPTTQIKDPKGVDIITIQVKNEKLVYGTGYDLENRELLYEDGTFYGQNLEGKSNNCTEPLFGNNNNMALETRFGDGFSAATGYEILTTNYKSVKFSWWEGLLDNVEDLVEFQHMSIAEAEAYLKDAEIRGNTRNQILGTLSFENPEIQPVEFACREVDTSDIPRG